MNYFLFDDQDISSQLKPFTFTRPVALIRIGIFTQKERWENLLGTSANICASERLSHVWNACEDQAGIWINAAWIPTPDEVELVKNLPVDASLVSKNYLLATHVDSRKSAPLQGHYQLHRLVNKNLISDPLLITQPWEIFSLNGKVLRSDFEWVRQNRKSEAITDPFTHIYNPENVFVEKGADVKAAIINAEDGPVYIGAGVQIQEGSLIKGPVAFCDHSVVNMGAKIRPDTTIGPYCKVGGEINNCVFFGYSNKAHDGFLGNSVIGEWCNLGADTNNSNLKNNYSEVKIFSYAEQKMIGTGLQFCGLLMGDHSKTSINSMLNTGTVVGVGCNIFDGGFPPKHIVSFSWGGSRDGFELFRFEKFLEAESKVYARRKREISPEYKNLLEALYSEFYDLHRV
ncbi:MAG TPA: GlmU family protein [Catalimonadaceae bacterium]|nr:GlmU family protein [Catalimonadaceae bacterium]